VLRRPQDRVLKRRPGYILVRAADAPQTDSLAPLPRREHTAPHLHPAGCAAAHGHSCGHRARNIADEPPPCRRSFTHGPGTTVAGGRCGQVDNLLPRAHPQRRGNTLMTLGAPGPAFSTGCALGSPAPTCFDPGTTSHARSVPPIFIPLYGLWPCCFFAPTQYVYWMSALTLFRCGDVVSRGRSPSRSPYRPFTDFASSME
jgi:hypothetical protein